MPQTCHFQALSSQTPESCPAAHGASPHDSSRQLTLSSHSAWTGPNSREPCLPSPPPSVCARSIPPRAQVPPELGVLDSSLFWMPPSGPCANSIGCTVRLFPEPDCFSPPPLPPRRPDPTIYHLPDTGSLLTALPAADSPAAARAMRPWACSAQTSPCLPKSLGVDAKVLTSPVRPSVIHTCLLSRPPAHPPTPRCILATLASLPFLEPSRHVPASGPLHLLAGSSTQNVLPANIHLVTFLKSAEMSPPLITFFEIAIHPSPCPTVASFHNANTLYSSLIIFIARLLSLSIEKNFP